MSFRAMKNKQYLGFSFILGKKSTSLEFNQQYLASPIKLYFSKSLCEPVKQVFSITSKWRTAFPLSRFQVLGTFFLIMHTFAHPKFSF